MLNNTKRLTALTEVCSLRTSTGRDLVISSSSVGIQQNAYFLVARNNLVNRFVKFSSKTVVKILKDITLIFVIYVYLHVLLISLKFQH